MTDTTTPGFLGGGGQMGALMRAHDWTQSTLGPPEHWPQTLRTVVRIMLNTGHPMYIFWGPDHACLYNDAYSESIGPERHPVSLGRPGRDVWDEIWHIIGPQIDQVMDGKGATWHVDALVPITRHGRREDVYWTYSYSPIDDETAPAGVGGVLVVCSETTAQVLAGRRKDEFLAMLAHELRNPLAPIRTGLELIRLAGSTPGAVERVRAMMERQIGQMVRLIDDLLDVSRITTGKIQLKREPTALDTLVGSAVDANRPAIAAKQVSLSVDLPDTTCVLDVDPTRFVQILSNLLHNAMKFTDPGGTIHLTARDARDAAARTLAVTIRDSGRGIAADLLPRVFDLFVQGNRESSQPGLGIGLALARELTEMHGGTISARSDGPGRGTEFEIVLPLSTHEERHTDARTNDTLSVARRVLIIDDNEDGANVMAMLVEALGGTAMVAYGAEGAVATVREFRADVVLLDIGMHPIDGHEACRRIRRAVGPDVLMIALTGWGQAHDKQKALDAGFDAHLTKPVDPAALERVLSSSSRGPARPARPDADDGTGG